jgi:uncharacterized OB-fold protein
MRERRPNRTLGGVHDQFWQFCQSRDLRLQQCRGCSTFVWPPVDSCEECGWLDLHWRPLSGTGRLKSWATVEQQYYDVLPVPWETILVELAEGPLFVSNPLGFTRNEMVLDLPLQVVFLDCEDDNGAFLLPVFRKRNDAIHL